MFAMRCLPPPAHHFFPTLTASCASSHTPRRVQSSSCPKARTFTSNISIWRRCLASQIGDLRVTCLPPRRSVILLTSYEGLGGYLGARKGRRAQRRNCQCQGPLDLSHGYHTSLDWLCCCHLPRTSNLIHLSMTIPVVPASGKKANVSQRPSHQTRY